MRDHKIMRIVMLIWIHAGQEGLSDCVVLLLKFSLSKPSAIGITTVYFNDLTVMSELKMGL